MTDLSRRAILRGGLAAGGLLGLGALAGCSPLSAGFRGTREIDFWHLLSGGDGMRMTDILSTVAPDLADARVQQTLLPWGPPYYTKLAMASAGGRAPDLGILHLSRLEGYAPGGLLDPWEESRLEPYGITRANFTEATWDRLTVGDELFAVPLDSHAFIRWFNPEIADQAGQLDGDGKLLPTESVDEFIEQALAFQGVTGDLGISYGYLGDAGHTWRLFYTFYTQQGGTMELTGGKVEFDQDAFVGAIEAVQKIVASDAANQRSDGGFSYSTFTSGGSGEFLSGVWELPSLQDSGIPLDASPIPNLFGTGIDAAWGDSHVFVLPHQTNPDEETREKTYEAVSLILKASLPWGGAGHTPAYLPVVEEPEFQELVPNANYAETAGYLQYDPRISFAGSGSNWAQQFSRVAQPAYMGTATAQDALREFEELNATYVRQFASRDREEAGR